jgi:hypothetical protein
MSESTLRNSHRFHIPVLGTGYSIDTPLKVAKYGISSVISIVDDRLVEEVRKYHSHNFNIPFTPIGEEEEDYRARRITAYLDLVDLLVKKQVGDIRTLPFEAGNELCKCFELLPEGELKSEYLKMLAEPEGALRDTMQNSLKEKVVAGSIDVNIMTKLDRQALINGVPVDAFYSDATAALRGYAKSTVESSIVFSAGLNPRLFGSIADYPDFYADPAGHIKKKIILKVSDFRSAQIQGTLLAKKGLWTSEYRIESGLNCGGHTFSSKGTLLGPILEEFRVKRKELYEKLHPIYTAGCKSAGRNVGDVKIKVTVQGGVGTAAESGFFQTYYHVDSVGWGTPFMLVPEVINLDKEHLQKLCEAGDDEVFLSEASPLGVPFWNLKTSASEEARKRRIREGTPGVFCKKQFLAFNTEFTQASICTASRQYQKLKLEELEKQALPEKTFQRMKENILAKACLCVDLAANITKKLGVDPEGTAAITAGPNIVNFSRAVTLSEMVAHIYGRINLITRKNRPHVFLREIEIYFDFLKKEIEDASLNIAQKGEKYFGEFQANLLAGIEYYREIADEFLSKEKNDFLAALETLRRDIQNVVAEPVLVKAGIGTPARV